MKCWCGAEMKRAGVGAYPYACIAADKHPGHLVFIGCGAGHSGWTHRELTHREAWFARGVA